MLRVLLLLLLTIKGSIPQGHKGTPDPCYNLDRTPRKCTPDFVNAAFEKGIRVGSGCEEGESLCTLANIPLNLHSTPTPTMGLGNSSSPVGRRKGKGKVNCKSCLSSPRHLTDLHNNNNPTCFTTKPGSSNNTLLLSLGKKYELTYVSLAFCTEKVPDSISIHKSVDFGRSWQSFAFYSTDCIGVFGKVVGSKLTRGNEQEAVCHPIGKGIGSRIAFSTLEGRPSSTDFESSPILQDWVTATDLRIELVRSISPVTLKDLGVEVDEVESYFSIADIGVGGRCKCNGHGSRCHLNKEGKEVCECKHNTSGDDCERCKPFYSDRPWGRGTAKNPQECKGCHCNGHTRRCRFNMELYRLSGKSSGGVCVRCRHNTAGRHCHYCKEGWFRDPNKPLHSRKACAPCDCHPIGASGRVCNQTTGQCPCKDGVSGLNCNRCLKGYQQSRSPIQPCVKIPNGIEMRSSVGGEEDGSVSGGGTKNEDYYDNDDEGGDEEKEEVGGDCECLVDEGGGRGVEAGLQTLICRRDYALQVNILNSDSTTNKERSKETWTRFTINIINSFKKTKNKLRVKKGLGYLWARNRDLLCTQSCSGATGVRVGRSYILIGNTSGGHEGANQPTSLLFTPRTSTIAPFTPHLSNFLRNNFKSRVC